MKQRIQEALRRRHRKEDEGFTLIELLVVILIIAILAAVGIVALLSALNAGKKSAATQTMRTAISTVKSVQTGLGQQDFTGVGSADLKTEEPDLNWSDALLESGETTNAVAIVTATNTTIVLNTRSSNGTCFYTLLQANGGTGYASAKVSESATCSAAPAGTSIGTGTTWASGSWFKTQSTGWGAK